MSDVSSPPKSPRGFRSESGQAHPTFVFDGSYAKVPDLVEGTDLETYDRMTGDPSVAAVMRSVELPIYRATYDIEPPPEPTELEKMQAKVVRESLFEYMSWPDTLKGALTYLKNGFSVQEYTLEYRDGYWLPRTISYRPASSITEESGTIARDKRGRLKYLTQLVDGQRHLLKRKQLIICSLDTPSPEYWRGRSLLYSAYKPWYIKEKMEIINSISQDRWGAGIVKVDMPPLDTLREAGIDIDENHPLYSLAEKAAQNVRSGENAYTIVPPSWKLGILDRSGNPTDPLPFIKELKEDIYISVLAGQLKLGGSDTTGSKALGVTFLDMFLHAVESWGQGIPDAYNRDLIRTIVDVNWGRQNRYPRMSVTNILRSALNALAYLIQTGAIPTTRELVKFIYDQYNIQIDIDKIPIPENGNFNRNTGMSNSGGSMPDNQSSQSGEDTNNGA